MIRPETSADYAAIYDFVKIAFETANVSNGKEQDFVNELRASSGYVPELALVEEETTESGASQIVGHIMLTKSEIVRDGGTPQETRFATLLLGPLAVALDKRCHGRGAASVRESFERAKRMGFTNVLLVGDPAYYGRFGFQQADRFDIHPTAEIPPQYVLICELVPGSLHGVSGVTTAF